MSTKATIAIGDGWHLYREMVDGTVELMIEGDSAEWYASRNGDYAQITVVLPSEIACVLVDAKKRLMGIGEE